MPQMTPTVVAKNLHKEYGEFTAVNDISFKVQSGEVFGVVGPNGAGKTTTLKMLAGLITPTSGSATVAGFDVSDSQMQQRLGFLPEESPLYESMTGVSYLQFFADLYDVPRDIASERIHEILNSLDLEHRNRKIGDMSKGMRRKVAIARSLVNDPDVLIYDEPASGLDPLTTNYVLEFVETLSDDGKTILFSAHNLHHVESLCDRVAVMNNGCVITQGTIDELYDTHGETTYHITTSANLDGATPVEEGYRITVTSQDQLTSVQNTIHSENESLLDVRTETDSLEDIVLDLSEPTGDA